ncbi:MAG: kinase, partial [Elainella sp.]
LSLLQKLAAYPTQWMGWQFTTSLETCKAQNEGRQQQVPEAVIEDYYQWMQAFEPDVAEGFAAVHPVPFRDGQFDFEAIEAAIVSLPQSIQKRRNKNASRELHPYSSLLAFERLIYLITALMQYPGLGNLQSTNPALLKRELGQEPNFSTDIAEISALLGQKYGQVYADAAVIQQNLVWLQRQGLLNASYSSAEFDLPAVADVPLESLHRYSDQDAFRRLMHLIRFMAHHPLLYAEAPAQKTADCLLEALAAEGNVQIHYSAATLRKDIETVLKPYRLMGEKRLRRGYFVGTGILSGPELLRVYHSLEGQAKHLSDPIALSAYDTFRQRMAYLGLDVHQSYPVRKVVDQPIVDPAYLSDLSLAQTQNASRLEAAIQTCETVELRRLLGTGRFPQDTDAAFEVLPLQIVFYNIAWYLGYQRLSDGLFQYDRLDRLTARFSGRFQERNSQRQALDQLNHLQQASYGLYLGSDALAQQQFLGQRAARTQVETQLELWFTTEIFRFVSEGTRRFPGVQMSSRKPLGISMTTAEQQQVFTLKGTGNKQFPHRLRANLPCWSIEGLELQGWILRFGDQVKVIAPDSLIRKVLDRAIGIAKSHK